MLMYVRILSIVVLIAVSSAARCNSKRFMKCLVDQSLVKEAELQSKVKRCFHNNGCVSYATGDFVLESRVPNSVFKPPLPDKTHRLISAVKEIYDDFSPQAKSCIRKHSESYMSKYLEKCTAGSSVPSDVINSNGPWPAYDDDAFVWDQIKSSVRDRVIECDKDPSTSNYGTKKVVQCARKVAREEQDGPRNHCKKFIPGCQEDEEFKRTMCSCAKYQFSGLYDSYAQSLQRFREMHQQCGLSFKNSYNKFKVELKRYCNRHYGGASANQCLLRIINEKTETLLRDLTITFFGTDIRTNYLWFIDQQYSCNIYQ